MQCRSPRLQLNWARFLRATIRRRMVRWSRSRTSLHDIWNKLLFSNFLNTLPFSSTNWGDGIGVMRRTCRAMPISILIAIFWWKLFSRLKLNVIQRWFNLIKLSKEHLNHLKSKINDKKSIKRLPNGSRCWTSWWSVGPCCVSWRPHSMCWPALGLESYGWLVTIRVKVKSYHPFLACTTSHIHQVSSDCCIPACDGNGNSHDASRLQPKATSTLGKEHYINGQQNMPQVLCIWI